jgi:geranylgeranyl diphosphate synthase type II
MHTPQQLIARFEDKFSKNNFHTTPIGLYEPVNHIMNIKGKRIRPLLLLISCDMFGGDIAQALNPAFAVELFHNFTLVHDDIMDNGDIRRGVPAVHKLYGLNAGILAGDVMIPYVYQYLTDIPAGFISPVIQVFNGTAIEIFEGQQMDVDFEKRDHVSEGDYLKMIEYKTSVLLGTCLQIGAILANADAQDQQLIYEFGLKLGLSFQIKDDYLDAYGETEKVGKKMGGDILMNKKTILYVTALNRANEQERQQLSALLHESDPDKKIEGVKQLFETTGARAHTLEKADELFHEAIKSLEKVSVKEELKTTLISMAQKINDREF